MANRETPDDTQLTRSIRANLERAEIDGQFIAGDGNVQVQLHVESGATVNFVAPPPAPVLVHPPIHVLPGEPRSLIGREQVLERLWMLLQSPPIEVAGEDGYGKTALVSHLLHELAATHDRVVYVDCSDHGAADGILAQMLFAFYECAYGFAPSPATTSRLVRPLAGLVALDHVALQRRQLESVLDQAQGCTMLVVGSVRRLAGRATFQPVGGLAPDAGAALLAQDVGHALTPAVDAELRNLSLAWDGHPLRLHRCADLLREEVASIPELIAAGTSLYGGRQLDEQTATMLDPAARRALLLAQAVSPHALEHAQIAALAGAGDDAARLLRTLTGMGLLEAHSPRYSIRAGLDEALVGQPNDWIEQAQAMAAAYAEWAPKAHFVDVHASAGALLRLQFAASMAGDWFSAVALARALDRVLPLTGRWEEWSSALARAEAAAQHAEDARASAWVANQFGVLATCNDQIGLAVRHFEDAARYGPNPDATVAEHNLRELEQAKGEVLAQETSSDPSAVDRLVASDVEEGGRQAMEAT